MRCIDPRRSSPILWRRGGSDAGPIDDRQSPQYLERLTFTDQPNAMAHLLFPTDLSDNALDAVRTGIALFGTEGNTFTLLYAFGAVGLSDPMLPANIPDLQQMANDGLAEFEEKLRSTTDLRGATVRRVAAFGPLPALIDEEARDQDIDLVVMASAGREGRSFFGSTTTSVIQGAHVPVLELPNGVRDPRFDRILFADDRSAIAPHTLDILAALARRFSSEVLIAHVATGRPAQDLVDNRPLFDQALAACSVRYLQIEHDQVEEAIFDLAEREQVDLIAMLHRHTGLWDGLFRSSTTRNIALHSKLPVLALEQ